MSDDGFCQRIFAAFGLEIYGKPSDTVLEAMKEIVGSGVALNIKPQPVGGYIRLRPG